MYAAILDGWKLAYGVLGVLITAEICTIIYNIYFHPLRHFPGPFWRRASRLPFALAAFRARQTAEIVRLHQKYGRIVRIGPNHLSFTDAQAWKDIYGHRTGSHDVPEHPKAETFYQGIPGISRHIINAGREEHSLLRRGLAHGFSDKAIRSQEVLVAHYVDLLLERLHENCASGNVPIEMVKWYNWTTFDIIGDLVFAESFGCLEEQRFHPFVYMILDSIRFSGFGLGFNYLGLHAIVATMASLGSFQRAFYILLQGLRAKIQKRLDNPVVRNDLFEGLVKRRKDWNLDMSKLEINAAILVVAGSETTATILSGVTYLLLQNPAALDKVTREVRSAFASADEINFTSVNKLTYMVACLSEALRRYPPVPANMVRSVVGSGGSKSAVIAGHVVPAGTMVEVGQWAMNHDEEYWHDPWMYRPERFLDGGDGDEKSGQRDLIDALQPFSYGPRNCIGRNLAYAEMRLILARVLFDFDLRLDDSSKGWAERQKANSLWIKLPLNVYLTPVAH
ncbi:cytochrome P450 [Cladorrhinum sp. PSN259]|nr:cytochrome P450 [Cladorrhinum sp. PSN259]